MDKIPQFNKEAKDLAGRLLKDWVEAARKCRKRFMDSGREIARYGYATNFNFEYQKMPNWFRAKVSLTAEAIKVLGPNLYQNNPQRLLTPRPTSSDFAKKRMDIMSNLLNYTPKQTALYDESRSNIDEALIYGRGVMWSGIDQRTGLVTSQYDTVRNLFLDPNATRLRDLEMAGRKRFMTRFELVDYCKRYDVDVRETVMKIKSTSTRASDKDSAYEWEKQERDTDGVCFYEIYSVVGLHRLKGGLEMLRLMTPGSTEISQFDAPDEPARYLVSEDGDFIATLPWEYPIYKDKIYNRFPFSCLDFHQNPDDIWPVSPLESGLGYQRAINWLTTLVMGKSRVTMRTLMATLKINGVGFSPKQKDRILAGEDLEMIELEIKGENKKLGDFLQAFTWDSSWIGQCISLMNYFEEKYRMTTGLYAVLYAGEGQNQSRSATDASMKERNSRSRIEDMREHIANQQGEMARKEAVCSRYVYTRKDVAGILGKESADAWGFLVKPDKTGFEYWINYFMQSGMQQIQAVQSAQSTMEQAAPIDEAFEADYTVEVSSIRRRDTDLQLDLFKEQQNTVWPVLLQSPDPLAQAMAWDGLAQQGKVAGLEQSLVDEYKAYAAKLRERAVMMEQQAQMQPMAQPGAPGEPQPQQPPQPAPMVPQEQGMIQ